MARSRGRVRAGRAQHNVAWAPVEVVDGSGEEETERGASHPMSGGTSEASGAAEDEEEAASSAAQLEERLRALSTREAEAAQARRSAEHQALQLRREEAEQLRKELKSERAANAEHAALLQQERAESQRLASSLSECQSELSTANAQLTEARDSIQQLRSQLDSADSRLRTAANNESSRDFRIRELEEHLNSERYANNYLRAELQRLMPHHQQQQQQKADVLYANGGAPASSKTQFGSFNSGSYNSQEGQQQQQQPQHRQESVGQALQQPIIGAFYQDMQGNKVTHGVPNGFQGNNALAAAAGMPQQVHAQPQQHPHSQPLQQYHHLHAAQQPQYVQYWQQGTQQAQHYDQQQALRMAQTEQGQRQQQQQEQQQQRRRRQQHGMLSIVFMCLINQERRWIESKICFRTCMTKQPQELHLSPQWQQWEEGKKRTSDQKLFIEKQINYTMLINFLLTESEMRDKHRHFTRRCAQQGLCYGPVVCALSCG